MDLAGVPGADRAFADAVRAHRRRLGLTQEELAARGGLSVRGIGDLEAGRVSAPRSATVRLLAEAFGLSGEERDRFCESAAGRPAQPPPRAPVPPAQLPADVAGFTGRTEQLARLNALLPDTGTVMITAIDGMAGVGKTALAVHWAHRVADRFPDGQLYVDLRGYDAERPLAPVEVLAGFLHALGLRGADIPMAEDAAGSAYRSLLAAKRVLVVLDNAASAEQVRPLLPAGAGCLALVTSRDRLGGLVARDGARWFDLDVLAPAEAHTLLVHALGAARVQAEPAAAAELAWLCGHLPLALRIAAANLTIRPRQRIADQVARLHDGDRLNLLTVDGDPGSAVAGAFSLSYARLPEPARRLFRLLGLVPGQDIPVPAAAALAGWKTADVVGALETLARAHLVEERGAGRYACHDLLRRYAADRAREEEVASDREAARHRLFDWYLATAQAATTVRYPQFLRLPEAAQAPSVRVEPFENPAAAQAWLTDERANLAGTVRYTGEHGPRPVAWQLVHCLGRFWWASGRLVEGRAVASAALAAATGESDLVGQTAAHLNLAGLDAFLGHYPEALAHCERAVALAGEAGWSDGRAAALGSSAYVHARQGRLELAAACLTEARELDYGSPARLAGLATTVNTLGGVYQDLGQLTRAAECFQESVAAYRQLGLPGSAYAIPLCNLGIAMRDLGRLDEALDHVGQALTISRAEGHRPGEAAALVTLATVHCAAGRYPRARDAAQAAVRVAGEIGYRLADVTAGNTLGTIDRCLGRPRQALEHHRHALELARRDDERAEVLDARLGLAAAHRELGEQDRAQEYARRVLETSRALGYRLREGRALAILAEVHLDRGDHRQAREHAELALDNHRQTGYWLGETHAEQVLGSIRARGGGTTRTGTGGG